MTADGKSLLQIVNENPKWNGKLSEIYRALSNTLSNLESELSAYEQFQEYWTEGNTNLTYIFADFNSGKLYTNRQVYTDINNMQEYVKNLTESGKYVVVTPKLCGFQRQIWIRKRTIGLREQWPVQTTICMWFRLIRNIRFRTAFICKISCLINMRQ